MDSLRTLQAAFTAAIAERNGTSALLNQLQTITAIFGEEWKTFLVFLEKCQGYAHDYIAFCKYSSHHAPADSVAPMKELSMSARKLLAEARCLRKQHEQELEEFRKFKTTSLYLFGQSPLPVSMGERTRAGEFVRFLSMFHKTR